MNKAVVSDIDVNGKSVLVRVDFNVPIKNGVISDDTRIRAALPTILYLLDHNAAVILMSHLGRPKGKVIEELRMAPVGKRLSELLNRPVKTLKDCIGPEVREAVKSMKPGDVILLENLRFHPEEEAKSDDGFTRELASLGDIYVNDAFGTAHRPHASTTRVAHHLPAVAGFLMEKELNFLGKLLLNPDHPFLAILGGIKVSDKIGVFKNMVNLVNGFLVGGAMAFTFLKVQGKETGKSILDEKEDLAKEIIDLCKQKGVELLLPVDVLVATGMEAGISSEIVDVDHIPPGKMGVDIGPRTEELFASRIRFAKTIFWNGPMGVFENPDFAHGTLAVARAIADSSALSCVGGGDSVSAIKKMGLEDKFTHISTGGGASLEFLEGEELPGVAVLMDKKKIRT
ncbi:MAG: phosphoglycerate kinase [Candidatus Eremiobacteraeota bacterium]|nr:phosphoglycerate kinase [Candidatus Eremiobacteraeota bacterium]